MEEQCQIQDKEPVSSYPTRSRELVSPWYGILVRYVIVIAAPGTFQKSSWLNSTLENMLIYGSLELLKDTPPPRHSNVQTRWDLRSRGTREKVPAPRNMWGLSGH